MANLKLSYKEIFDLFIDCEKDIEVLVGVIATNNTNISMEDIQNLKQFLVKFFIPKFKIKWNNANRHMQRFLDENANWLSKIYTVEAVTETEEESSTSRGKRGRPMKSFEDSKERSKRSKVQELCEDTSAELILSAAKQLDKSEKTFKMFSTHKALSLIVDAALSKHQYEVLRSSCKEVGCDIFPLYQHVLDAKKECYPPNVEVHQNLSKVSLQSLLDHTVTRIVMTKSETELADFPNELMLISKWGCDGSSGHSEYNQAFSSEGYTDKNMFLTSLVPLKFTEYSTGSRICWINNEPSSTRFCRPIKFEFAKESQTVINAEIHRMNSEICNLRKTIIEINNKKIEVTHSLSLTMIDGKVASTMTGTTSMAVCFICGSKPTEMNNLDALLLKKNSEDALKFGISPLHARIKFMECILHIAYNKTFRAWRVNSVTKPQRDVAKAEIQSRLKAVLGINVDVVKQGMGTTNDGNTSRRFFENPSITADVIGINTNLIHRFKIILATINCSAAIDPAKFHQYAMDTAKLYVELYGWYYMPITVHKVLIHGSRIISEAVLPIGMLSEEAQEARNKDYRSYRLHHSRKCSRSSTNEDVMHHLLVSSDPFINKFRHKLKVKKLEYHDDVKELLKKYD